MSVEAATSERPAERPARGAETGGSRKPVRIAPVESRRDLSAFIEVPWTVYAGDPLWVPPLRFERRQHLAPKNPFFRHARARFWVAYRGGRPVGRISAQVDDLHLERYRDATGYFGFVEAIDDDAVFAALIAAAESWLREQGMRRVIGPFSFSINDECGLLVDGFDTPPMFMMGHARPYYDDRVRACGYRKAKDTVAYMLETTQRPPSVMEATVQKAASGRIRTRALEWSRLRTDLATLREIFNDAWVDNWNYVPFTVEEFDALGESLKLFVPNDWVQIAEVDGAPAGMIVVVPNLNDIVADLDGRLFPFGWARLLWRLKRAGPHSARVPLMGVRKEYQRSALGMALVFLLVEAVRQPVITRGIDKVELSWTLEDNRPMRHIKDRLGARPYKTYRIYERDLA
jgi:hypothetical protein